MIKSLKHVIKKSAIHSEFPVKKGCIPGEDPYQRPYTYLTKTFQIPSGWYLIS